MDQNQPIQQPMQQGNQPVPETGGKSKATVWIVVVVIIIIAAVVVWFLVK